MISRLARTAVFAFVAGAASLAAPAAIAQPSSEMRELAGQLGSRRVLVMLNSTRLPDGNIRVNGEYLILPTMQRFFVEGDRSPKLGVTTLREGSTPIFFGRPATATLQGVWRDGVFKGSRLGPGGQLRERFEFSETFPDMSAHAAAVSCESGDTGYGAQLEYAIEAGKLKPGSFTWRTRQEPSGHTCLIGPQGVQQVAMEGGLRFVVGGAGRSPCAITLRDTGDGVRVAADNCGAYCGSSAYFESMLVDSRSRCQVMRPQSR